MDEKNRSRRNAYQPAFSEVLFSIRNAQRAGVPQTVCMALSGHRTTATWIRYNITSTDDLRAAIGQTAKYNAAEAARERKKVVSR